MDAYKNRGFLLRLRFAVAGLVHCWQTERSLRAQSIVSVAVLLCLAMLRPAPLWWALIIICSTTVLAAELFNSALERLADHLHPKLHPQIRIVKDYAAAAVLLVALGAVGVAAALATQLLKK